MAKTKKKKPSKWTEWWINFFEKRFYIPPIFSFISALWFPLVVVLLGKSFHIVNGSNEFTIFGIISSALIFIIPAFFTILQTITDRSKQESIAQIKKQFKDEEAYSTLLATVTTSFSKLCEKKCSYIIGAIAQEKDKASAYDCRDQLETILDQLDQCASYILSQKNARIKSQDLYVSLYYQFRGDDQWHCVNRVQGGLTTADLLDKDTTFKYLLNDSTPDYVFFNSKEEAKGEQHYAKDGHDILQNNELAGSIIGYRFSLVTEDIKYIDAMLFLSTYSKRVVNSSDKNTINIVKNNLEEFVLRQFSKRISIELGLWYLGDKNQRN